MCVCLPCSYSFSQLFYSFGSLVAFPPSLIKSHSFLFYYLISFLFLQILLLVAQKSLFNDEIYS